jgi:hypothetical protein
MEDKFIGNHKSALSSVKLAVSSFSFSPYLPVDYSREIISDLSPWFDRLDERSSDCLFSWFNLFFYSFMNQTSTSPIRKTPKQKANPPPV